MPGASAPKLIADPRVAAVTLTGTERAGAFVAAAAGAALKKSVLELGGCDPFVVLADADLDHTIEHAVKGRLMCAGQTCIAPKRFLVDAAIADEFETRLVGALEAVQDRRPARGRHAARPARAAGHPRDPRAPGRATVAQGATLQDRRQPPRPPGLLLPADRPLRRRARHDRLHRRDVRPGRRRSRASRPRTSAIELANDTRYGLGATVWSKDAERAHALARRIDSGAVAVDALVASDPRLPFGGIKRSGYGRELAAVGVREFTNIRTYKIACEDVEACG